MNLADALGCVRFGGHWIRRRAWPEKQAIFHDEDALDGGTHGLRNSDGVLGSYRGSFSREAWTLTLTDLCADDWETTARSPGYEAQR